MLNNVRIHDDSIVFELTMGSSTWRFLVGRDVIEALSLRSGGEATDDIDVSALFEEFKELLQTVAINLISKGVPTGFPEIITLKDIP